MLQAGTTPIGKAMHIGGREVVHSSSLVIPEGEDASFEFLVGAWRIKIRVDFDTTDDTKKEAEIRLEPSGDELQITFLNWDNSLGMATTEPVQLGRSSTGQSVFLMAAHHKIGVVNKLDINCLLSSN